MAGENKENGSSNSKSSNNGAPSRRNIVAKCLTGYQAGPKTFKVHLDGYNLMPFFKGEVRDAPRNEFLYWNDDGELVAIRAGDWKVVFKAQEHEGIDVWRKEFTSLRTPKLFNLRADPFERGDTSMEYENGSSTGPSSSCQRKLWSGNGLAASRNIPSVRSPGVSTSMTSWRR